MQEFNILKSLTANTTVINSDLTIFNNYYLNDEIFDNKLVNKFNVRNFLIDSKNNSLVSNFTSFTHNKLSLLQIDYIYSSDEILSNALNNYYENYYLSSGTLNLTGNNTTQIFNYNEYYHELSGSEIENIGIYQSLINNNIYAIQNQKIQDISKEKDYFVNIFIEDNSNTINKFEFKECENNESQYAQCFVNLNIEKNENVWFDNLASIGFKNNELTLSNGKTQEIILELDKNASGNESVQLYVNLNGTNITGLTIDEENVNENFHRDIIFNAGDTQKEFTISLNSNEVNIPESTFFIKLRKPNNLIIKNDLIRFLIESDIPTIMPETFWRAKDSSAKCIIVEQKGYGVKDATYGDSGRIDTKTYVFYEYANEFEYNSISRLVEDDEYISLRPVYIE